MSNPYPSINVGSIPANDGAARGALAIGAGLSDLGRAAGGIANNLQQTKDAMAREQARRESAARDAEVELFLAKTNLSLSQRIQQAEALDPSQRGVALDAIEKDHLKGFDEDIARYAQTSEDLAKYRARYLNVTNDSLTRITKNRLTLPTERAQAVYNDLHSSYTSAGAPPSLVAKTVFPALHALTRTMIGGPESVAGQGAIGQYSKQISAYTSDYVGKGVHTAKVSGDLTQINAAYKSLDEELAVAKQLREEGIIRDDEPLNHILRGMESLDIARREITARGDNLPTPSFRAALGKTPVPEHDELNKGILRRVANNGAAVSDAEVAAELSSNGFKVTNETISAYKEAVAAVSEQVIKAARGGDFDALSTVFTKFGPLAQKAIDATGLTVDPSTLPAFAEDEQQLKTAQIVMASHAESMDANMATAYMTKGAIAQAQNKNAKIAFPGLLAVAQSRGLVVTLDDPDTLTNPVYTALVQDVKSMANNAEQVGLRTILQTYPGDVGAQIVALSILSDERASRSFSEDKRTGDQKYKDRAMALQDKFNTAGIKPTSLNVEGQEFLFKADSRGGLVNNPSSFQYNWFGALTYAGRGYSTNTIWHSEIDKAVWATDALTESNGQITADLRDSGDLRHITDKLIGSWSDENQLYKQAGEYTGLREDVLRGKGAAWAQNAVFVYGLANGHLSFKPVTDMPGYSEIMLSGKAGSGQYKMPSGAVRYVSDAQLGGLDKITAAAAEMSRRDSTFMPNMAGFLTKGPDAAFAVASSIPAAIERHTKDMFDEGNDILSSPVSSVRSNGNTRGSNPMVPFANLDSGGSYTVDHRAALKAKSEGLHTKFKVALSSVAYPMETDSGLIMYVPRPDGMLTEPQLRLIAKVNETSRLMHDKINGGNPDNLSTNSVTAPAASAAAKKNIPEKVVPDAPAQKFYTRFSKDRHPSAVIKEQLSRAEGSLDVTMYTFTDPERKMELVEAARRGVRVRVVLDPNQDKDGSTGSFLRSQGIAVRYYDLSKKTGIETMHIKEVIGDHWVLDGSYNYTTNAKRSDNESVTLSRGTNQANKSREVFEERWKASGTVRKPTIAKSETSKKK